MIKILRDLTCPNTLDCNKVYGLEDGIPTAPHH
jgi:uncharacterized protein YbaR (Trm112 family)